MSQFNAAEFYQSAIIIYRNKMACDDMINIQSRFSTFAADIIIEVERIIKQSSEINIINKYNSLNVSKICKQKLKDFDLTPRMFNEGTKLFYKAIVAGLRRQFDRFSGAYEDNYRTKRLKTNKDRLQYYFVEMVLYNKAVIIDGTWLYYGSTYTGIREGDVGRLIRHYLRNRCIETHKLGGLFRIWRDVESLLYDIRDANRGYCWRLKAW